MSTLWQAVFALAVACTFLASMRIAVVGLNHLPINPWLRFFTHDRWAASLVLFVPWFAGEFARREISALPWIAFSKASARHGVADGLITVLLVLTLELWFLWIPAHSYVLNHPELDRRAATLARLFNLAVGLLLLTPQNPIYKLIELLPASDPDNY